MKPPGWFTMTYEGRFEDGLLYTIRVRRWHPGFWWFVLQTRLGRRG